VTARLPACALFSCLLQSAAATRSTRRVVVLTHSALARSCCHRVARCRHVFPVDRSVGHSSRSQPVVNIGSVVSRRCAAGGLCRAAPAGYADDAGGEDGPLGLRRRAWSSTSSCCCFCLQSLVKPRHQDASTTPAAAPEDIDVQQHVNCDNVEKPAPQVCYRYY